MSTEILKVDPTPQEIAEAKIEEIKAALKIDTVYPLIFKDEATGEDIFGYMKEPPRFVKLRILDKSMQGMFTAAQELLEAVLLKEYSSPRIYSDRPQDDEFNIGATMAAYELVKASVNQFKKK